MGYQGHALGKKGIKKLRRVTGLPLVRGWRDHKDATGVVWNDDGTCTHYRIDFRTGEYTVEDVTTYRYFQHLSSCPGGSTHEQVKAEVEGWNL